MIWLKDYIRQSDLSFKVHRNRDREQNTGTEVF